MANGKFRGWIWCNDGTSSDPTGYIFSPGGLHGTTSNEVAVSNVYLWRGNTHWCVQFNCVINEANVKQGGWGTFDTATSGARGTRGLAFGSFAITLGGTSYLFMPYHVFGYYDGGTLIKLFVSCTSPLIS